MAQRLQDRPVNKGAKKGGDVLKGLIAIYLGLRAIGLGMDSLFYSGIHLAVLISFALGIVLFVTGLRRIAGKEKKKRESGGLFKGRNREDTFTPSRPTSDPTFSFRADDHQHIRPAGLSVERQLEQLEVLWGQRFVSTIFF